MWRGRIAGFESRSRTAAWRREPAADAIAQTDIDGMALHRNVLRDLVGTSPDVAEATIALLWRKQRDTSELVEQVARNPLGIRVARNGVAHSEGDGAKGWRPRAARQDCRCSSGGRWNLRRVTGLLTATFGML